MKKLILIIMLLTSFNLFAKVQVKTFIAETPYQLDSNINLWLNQNKGVAIKDIKYQSNFILNRYQDAFSYSFSAMIIYDDGKE